MKRLMVVALVLVALVLMASPAYAQISAKGDNSPSIDLPLVDETKEVFTDEDGRLYQKQNYQIWIRQIVIKEGKRGINVRSGPGTSFNPPLGKVNEGERFDHLGKVDGWYRFLYNGEEAYIGQKFADLKKKGRKEQAPEPKRIYVRRQGFFEKKVGVGPFPDLPLWSAIAIGIVVVFLLFLAFRGKRKPPRRAGHAF